MEDAARQKLKTLISERGRDFYKHPRCIAILEEYCVPHKREANLLINALKEDVPKAILAANDNPLLEEIINQLAQKLVANHGTSIEMSQWAVESWAEALGVYESHPGDRKKTVRIGIDDRNNDDGLNQQDEDLRKRRKLWRILGTAGTALFVFIGGLTIYNYSRWQDLNALLQQAKSNQFKGEYWKCVVDARRVIDNRDLSQQALEIQNSCYLGWANELAKTGQLSEAIEKVKLVDTQEAKKTLEDLAKGRPLKLVNNCSHAISVLLYYKNLSSDQWDSNWFERKAGEGDTWYVNLGENKTLFFLDPIYYYAFSKTTSNSTISWPRDEEVAKTISLENKTYAMGKLLPSDFKGDNFRLGLKCTQP
jgi:hypothetical protein